MCVLHKWCSRYESQSTPVEYLPIFALSLAEYSYWWHPFLPILLIVSLSFTIFVRYGRSLVEAGTLMMKSALMVRELLVCHYSLNTAAMLFYNCNLMWKWHMCIQLCNYYWWIKYWWFYPTIANNQSLLCTNILSYMYRICENLPSTHKRHIK